MRAIAAISACLVLASSLSACQNSAPALPQDMTLGNPNAKVTVVEYASLGCPICGKWDIDNFQAFKAKYIDTGKVRYVFREFLTGDAPVAAAGFLLARCAGKDKYFQVIDEVFHSEADLIETNENAEKRERLVRIAESAGLTEPQFDACVNNDAALEALNKRVQGYAANDHIDATPTFVINGKPNDGYLPMAQMDQAVAAAEAGAK